MINSVSFSLTHSDHLIKKYTKKKCIYAGLPEGHNTLYLLWLNGVFINTFLFLERKPNHMLNYDTSRLEISCREMLKIFGNQLSCLLIP